MILIGSLPKNILFNLWYYHSQDESGLTMVSCVVLITSVLPVYKEQPGYILALYGRTEQSDITWHNNDLMLIPDW